MIKQPEPLNRKLALFDKFTRARVESRYLNARYRRILTGPGLASGTLSHADRAAVPALAAGKRGRTENAMNDHRPKPGLASSHDHTRNNSPLRWAKLHQQVDSTGWLPGYGIALLASLGVTLAAMPLSPHLDHANIVMLFLLALVGVAARYGRGPAVLVAVSNVLAFNFVFMPPHFAFAFETLQSILTFAVMLIVGLSVGQLTARFRHQVQVARAREERACFLYEMARELSGAATAEQVIEVSERCVATRSHVQVRLLLPNAQNRLQPPVTQPGQPDIDLAIAQWCFDHNELAGLGTDCQPDAPLLYLPLKAPLRTRGVLVAALDCRRLPLLPEQSRLLETLAVLIAIVLERVHFAAIARDTQIKMEAERERSALLAGLSHDLRTPMTALIGLTDTLALALPAEQSPYQDSLMAIREQAQRMVLLVDNLLDMARLQAGRAWLRKDWQSLEELVGAAVRLLEQPLRDHPLRLALDPELPLVDCDAILIERVLVNLLQNAAKHTPAGTVIGMTARATGDQLTVTVWDEGPGLPVGREQALFEKFARGPVKSVVSGVGLGLAVCQSIIQAHGGYIHAANRATGGACFTFTLPLQTPPPLEFSEDFDPHPT